MADFEEQLMNSRHKLLKFTATVDFANMAATGNADEQSVTCAGVALGDAVVGVAASIDLDKVVVWGRVSAANTVKLVIENLTAGALNPASCTVTIWVLKAN